MKTGDHSVIIILTSLAGIYFLGFSLVFISLIIFFLILYAINFVVGIKLMYKDIKMREKDNDYYWKMVKENPEIVKTLIGSKMGFN